MKVIVISTILSCLTLVTGDSRPRAYFSVNPDQFVIGQPFTARCTIETSNAFDKSLEVTFFVHTPIANRYVVTTGELPYINAPIASYLLSQGYAVKYRHRSSNASLLTVTGAESMASYPTFEIEITPLAPEARTIYGCFVKPSITLFGQNESFSNLWNANAHYRPWQPHTALLIAIAFVVIKLFGV